jgi:hypothetical protein
VLNPFVLAMSVYQTVVVTVGFFHLRRYLPGVLGGGTRSAWPNPDQIIRRQQRLKRREKIITRLSRLRGRRP